MSKIRIAALAAWAGIAAGAAQAAPITVDGNFSDWGVNNNGSFAGWTPGSGILYTVEDQSNANGGYLSPGWGGQAYDAEALYLTWNTKANGQTYLYIGLITGHDPNTPTGGNSYGRGDFAFDFDRNGSWDFAVLTADRSASLHQGDVVKTTNADWAKGLWNDAGQYDPAHSNYVTKVNTGIDVGNAALSVSTPFQNMGTLGGNHWFYEVEVPVSVFGEAWQGTGPSKAFDVQWTMLCANDMIVVDPPVAPPPPGGSVPGTVPEPGSVALMLGALSALGLSRRRTRR